MASIFLVIYLLLIRLYGFAHPVQVADGGGVLYLAFIELFQKNKLVLTILATIIVFSNAILINRILFLRRVTNHRDYFAALIYILLSGSLIAFQNFTPLLLGSVFILLAINRLFNLAKESEKRETDYYIGLLIGLAGLISPFYFIFIIPALLSMFLFGSFRLNEILAMLVGWINPLILVGAYFYLIGQGVFFLEHTFTFHYAAYLLFEKWTWGTYIVSAIFMGLFFLAVFIQPLLMTKKQHHAKQFIRVIYNFLFTAFASVLFLDLSNHSYLFLLILFLAIIFGIYFKRKNGEITWTMELIHFGFFIFVLLNQYSFQLA